MYRKRLYYAQQRRKQATLHMLKLIIITLTALCYIWIFASYMDIVSDNLSTCERSSWNLITLISEKE